MKLIMFMILSVGYLLASGCARDNVIGMNCYQLKTNNSQEKVIGSSVVVTEKMINDIKKRRKKFIKKKK